jgi:membrane protein implicated in regulation of membrane protease activity
VLLDDQPRPIFPRCVAYFSFGVALVMAPSVCAAVVQSGPLAWNGFVSFWLRIIAYAVFLVVMFFVLRSAIERERTEQLGSARTPGAAATAR